MHRLIVSYQDAQGHEYRKRFEFPHHILLSRCKMQGLAFKRNLETAHPAPERPGQEKESEVER